ncbi:MAG: SusC/RagA family TonB-linked outer membrane protein [Bacteroidetes bacterium]|nr:SusC/RagA family TonB-linked outer membrane protein [Bacteroidota bacterium]
MFIIHQPKHYKNMEITICVPLLKRAFTKTLHFPDVTLSSRNTRHHKTIFLAMKLIAVIMLASCLTASAKSFSQVSVSLKNADLEKVFAVIEKQTGYYFVYSKEVIKNANPVTIDVKNGKLDYVLDICFKDQPLSFSITDKVISVRAKLAYPDKTITPSLDEEPPPINISGTVTTDMGAPVVGASVMVKGTTKGTTTNDIGYFSLADVDNNATLIISGTNIEKTEIKVNGKNIFNIVAKIKVSVADEIQIIGYGSTTKRLNTGAIATIKGEDIKDRPVSSIISALQGQLSGVAITSGTGLGAAPTILIRGQNSISSGTNPLIIVDGVVVNSNTDALMNSAGAGGFTANSTLNFINPADIQSIEVLKDADATSIYGSRGTNGVILITTRQATLGKTKMEANVTTGWKSATVLAKRMNTPQYLQMRKDAFATGNVASATSVINPITPTAITAPDLLVYDQNTYTDYLKIEDRNPAPNYNADLKISGGTRALSFIASASYFKMYDIYLFKPYQERATASMQINHTSFNNKFNMHLGGRFAIDNQTTKVSSVLYSYNMMSAGLNPPNFQLYNADGSLNLGPGYSGAGFAYNPYANETTDNKSNTKSSLLDADLSYTLIKGLTAKLQVSYQGQRNTTHQLYPSTAVNIQDQLFNPVPFGIHSSNQYTSVNVEPQLSYTGSISKANFTALAGGTYLDIKNEIFDLTVTDPGNDALLNSYAAGMAPVPENTNTEEKFESVFARIKGDWDKKYLLNINFRRDGSSRFGPDNRFANFASIGAGWIFSSESFMKKLPFLSFGKLRGSYGTSGNNNIADYQYLSLLAVPWGASSSNTYPDYAVPLAPSNYPNVNVKWETTTKREIGLELGFLKDRIRLSAEYYKHTTTDLLLVIPLGQQSGFSSYTGNFPGVVQNTGFEFDITTQNLGAASKVKWTTKFNLTNTKNILKSFPGIEKSTYSSFLQIGRALTANSFLEQPYQFTGIDPATGLPKITDLNKGGSVDYADRFINAAWIGSSRPTLFGGLTNSVSYKGFTLDIFLQFANGIFTRWNYGTLPTGTIANPIAEAVGNYWMKPGDVTKYPRLYTGQAVGGNSTFMSSLTQFYNYSTATLYKGYYIRLKNVQLNYSIPTQVLSRLKASSATLFISGENLGVYCPGKLFKDPETIPGNSTGIYRTITTGLRMVF